jgi:hypothetical protein
MRTLTICIYLSADCRVRVRLILTLGHVTSIRNRHVRITDTVLTLLAILLLDVCGEPDLDPAPDSDDALLHLHHDRHQQEV